MEHTCPFCNPSIGDAAFARSRNFLAVYNLAPILPGHSLIIPRKHIESMLELDESMLTEMIDFARKVTRLLQKVFDTEGFNWSIQDREIAGQTIMHLHLHIVLRYPGDLPEPGDWYPKLQENAGQLLDSGARERLTPEEMQKIVSRLRMEKLEEF
ncbi:MAG: HIT family protein [Bacteroidales bacterium]|nr:HIT family protein [Bacteroidales bacterium]